MPSDQTRSDTEVLEEGDIFFFYRPRVEEEEPSGLSDVQRFFTVLRPRGGHKLRLLIIGRKRLPETNEHEKNWGFVDRITSSEPELERTLREASYETKTRGEQTLPAARPAGEGVYALFLQEGGLHLAYSLELPEQSRDVQKTLKIARDASYAISIKNPEAGQPRAAGLRSDEQAHYPERLQEEFHGRRFSREDARLLDYEGAEILLIGADSDPEREYDLELEGEQEDYEGSDTVRHLRMVKSRHPVTPLFEGRWR